MGGGGRYNAERTMENEGGAKSRLTAELSGVWQGTELSALNSQ
jgi:hypothetical protein